MNHGQGFSANLATGLLVTTASLFGLPVSTTRVALRHRIDKPTGRFSVSSQHFAFWLVTLPCAAVIGAFVCWLTKH